MVISGHYRSFLVISGYFWSFSVIFGQFWSFLVISVSAVNSRNTFSKNPPVHLFFQVNPTQEMPNGVEYAVQSCRVVNTNQDIAYRFYEDGCENARVSASRYDHASFSYRLFRFGHDSVSNVALSCQVNVCLDGLGDTSCQFQETGSCGGGESWVETDVSHLL